MDNTTPNYAQQIEEARKRQAGLAGEVQTMTEAQPGLTQEARQAYYADPLLKTLQGSFSDKMMELYNYDKMKAAAGMPGGTVTTQGGYEMPFNPQIASQGAMNAFDQILKQKEDMWKMYEDRKNLIGNELDKAVKLYESKIKLKESQRSAIKDEIDSLQSAWTQTSRDAKDAQDTALAWATLSQKGQGTGVTGDQSIDSLRDEDAISLAETTLGLKFTGGTPSERGARAKSALDEYKKNGYVSTSRYLDQLGAQQVPVASLADVVKRANELTESLAPGKEVSGPITGRYSKFMADIMGKTGEASMIGKELEEMSADKIKERYGGALTTTEVSRLTKQAITGRNVQEASNIESLAIMKKNAVSLIEEKLRAAGWKQQAIEQYLKEINASGTSGVNQGGWVDEGFIEQ